MRARSLTRRLRRLALALCHLNHLARNGRRRAVRSRRPVGSSPQSACCAMRVNRSVIASPGHPSCAGPQCRRPTRRQQLATMSETCTVRCGNSFGVTLAALAAARLTESCPAPAVRHRQCLAVLLVAPMPPVLDLLGQATEQSYAIPPFPLLPSAAPRVCTNHHRSTACCQTPWQRGPSAGPFL